MIELEDETVDWNAFAAGPSPQKMVTYSLIQDDATIMEFMLHPRVRDNALSDNERNWALAGSYMIDAWSGYLGVYFDHELIGIIKYEEKTDISLVVHPYIFPKHYRRWIDGVDAWFAKNTQAHKFIIETPRSCKSIIKMAARNGFEVEGVLIGAEYWRGKIDDIVIMARFIRGTQ